MEYESYQDASFNSVQNTFSVMNYEDILGHEESENPEQEPEKSGESAEESEKSEQEPEKSGESAEEAEESEKSEESAKELEEFGESAKEIEDSEKSEESAKESEETYTEFPNEAYKDLIILIT